MVLFLRIASDYMLKKYLEAQEFERLFKLEEEEKLKSRTQKILSQLSIYLVVLYEEDQRLKKEAIEREKLAEATRVQDILKKIAARFLSMHHEWLE